METCQTGMVGLDSTTNVPRYMILPPIQRTFASRLGLQYRGMRTGIVRQATASTFRRKVFPSQTVAVLPGFETLRTEQRMSVFRRLTFLSASRLSAVILIGCWLGLSTRSPVFAQTESPPSPSSPSPSESPSQSSPEAIAETLFPTAQEDANPAEQAEGSEESLSDEQRQQLQQWIEELGSNEFANRERAAGNLMTLGRPVIPALRRLVQDTNDPETRLRAEQIIKQLSEGDLQARIQEFLSGRDVGFSGWYVAQRFLGDSIPIRELFVEIMLAHPDLLESMEGTSRDRALALENLLSKVQPKLNTIRDEPVRADVFAMLLVGLDPEVPLSILYEDLLLRLTQRSVTTDIRRNAHLSGPFLGLLNRWIGRSSLTNREDVLLLGMDVELSSTLPLAILTLQEATQTETIATSLQAIAKFGGPEHVEVIKPLLEDVRPAGGPAISDDPSQVQICDLTMITIAMLRNLPLKELGVPHVQLHEARGFLLPDYAYPSTPVESRQKARTRIDQLLQQGSGAEES